MQPLIVLGLVGVAAVALGSGFLFQGQEIMVNLQKLGVGETDVTLPLSDAWVDLTVDHTEINTRDAQGQLKTILINRIVACSFHYSEFDVELDDDNILGPQSQVFCKLSDEVGDIIAEGNIRASNALCSEPDDLACLDASRTYKIPITEWACEPTIDNGPGDEECTRVGWVNDVRLVVLGTFDPDATPPIPSP